MAGEGIYFDGRSAKARIVSVIEDGLMLSFQGEDTPQQRWSIKGLHPIDPPSPGQPYRLSHEDYPSQRLVIRDGELVARLVARSPHLKGGYSLRDIGHLLGWTVGGLAACAGLAYVALTLLPQPLAAMMPAGWRERTGLQMETAMAGSSKRCATPEGEHAIGTLLANLAEGTPDMPPVSVHVYDIPVLNAFAVNGGRIIVTSKLIAQADAPEELAGVLAHEIGHVAHHHPEAQSLRLAGMEILSSVISGSNGGSFASNVALLATVLRHSRAAESEADAYAEDMLTHASIDTQGMKRFFEKVLKLEGGSKPEANSTLAEIGNIFATHPGTEERIKQIKPLPPGVTPKPAMPDAEWKALKKICG